MMHATRSRLTLMGVAGMMMLPGQMTLAGGDDMHRDRSFSAKFESSEKNSDRYGSEDIAAQGIVVSPGVRLYTGATLSGGHDSNLDHVTKNPPASNYGRVELGAAAVVTGDNSQTVALARGSYANYSQDFRPDRWDGVVLVDHYIKVTNAWKLHFGGFYERNDIDVDRPTYAGGYAQIANKEETRDSFFRFRSMHTGYGNAIGSVFPSGFLSDVDRSFSNIRSEASLGTLLMKNRTVAPYFEVGAAQIDFTQQINQNVLDRDAREVYGIAGLRFTITPQLRVDLGVRGISREIEDKNFSHRSTAFFDGKLVWTPHDRLFVEFNVDRTNTDPLSANALYTERTAGDVHVTARLTEKVKMELEAGIARHDQIGIKQHYDEQYVSGRLGYQLTPRMELFSLMKTETIKDSVTEDSSHRFRIGGGVKLGF